MHDIAVHNGSGSVGADLVGALAIVIFATTYAGVAMGRLPFFRLDRTGVAFVGAALMVATGAIGFHAAMAAIDFNTITLLLGMMILAAALRRGGFFHLVTDAALARAGGPLALLAAIIIVAGLLSAVLVNDTVCVVLAPLVLDIVAAADRPPVPYLIALGIASNIGSVATITGNPQNIIIGSVSGLSYAHFAAALAPVAGLCLLACFAVIAIVWRIRPGAASPNPPRPRRPVRPRLIVKSLVLLAGFVIASLLGMRPAEAALIAAALILLTPGLKSATLLADVDWSLLLMFGGLFIVVAGLQDQIIGPGTIAAVGALHPSRPAILVPLTVLLSNLVSNVPAILVLKPFVAHVADPGRAWLLIAMASTLGGNLTLLGSVANLIVAERARARGIEIGFVTFLRIGAPITLISLLIGTLWLIAI